VSLSVPVPLERTANADLELARRHLAGDETAFEEVYRRHSELVYNLCRRLAPSAPDALDLAQDVFLRIHRHLGRFGGRSTLKTWIYRVAVNQCRSRLGRRRPPTEPLDDRFGRDDRWAAPGPDPEQRAAHAEQGRRVEAALARVPMRFRSAVVLRDVEGLSYEEIAGILGVPPGTVRSRIARGREALRIALEESA
jgi:RNA polymerase sigma-70 factor (ECF subfamily)